MMYKKILSAVLSLFIVGTSLPVSHNAFADDLIFPEPETNMGLCTLGSFTFLVSDDYAILTDCEDDISGRIVLPSKVMDVPLVRIEAGAFSDCDKLESIELGDNVEYIGKNTFKGCTSLNTIKMWNMRCNIAGGADTMGYPENVRIVSRSNSITEEYANYYGYQLEVFGGDIRGDVNSDKKVDAVDASNVLAEYSRYSTTKATPGEYMLRVCDINDDGRIDSIDASRILYYYAYASNGGEETFAFFHDYIYDNDFQEFSDSTWRK